MIKPALLLAIGALLVTPALARADTAGKWQAEALTTAQRVWHPKCGTLWITWETPPPEGIREQWGGWAVIGNCNIHMPAQRGWVGYPEFCTAVLHEAGHSAGLGHSTNMNSIMAPMHTTTMGSGYVPAGHGRWRHVTTWTGVDSRCVRPADRR